MTNTFTLSDDELAVIYSTDENALPNPYREPPAWDGKQDTDGNDDA